MSGKIYPIYQHLTTALSTSQLSSNPDGFALTNDQCGPHTQERSIKPGTVPATIVSDHYEGAKIIPIIPPRVFQLKAQKRKRVFDICFSLFIMTLGAPVFLFILIITKFSSSGPVFFKQVRIGKDQRTFHIYKFRSMYCNAEIGGPQLSRADDPRITKWGRIIRKTRLDELPQFWNVLKGEMSVVGPRPEREYFISQIIEKRPDYSLIQNIKPGITSLGQVNFGYAENVTQMCERLDHDLPYIKKISLRTDLIVIAKTVGVMIKGRGK